MFRSEPQADDRLETPWERGDDLTEHEDEFRDDNYATEDEHDD